MGGKTSLLDRAEAIGSFVRHGEAHAYTEIELYFESGNKVVRRDIYVNNTSEWHLNGKPIKKKAIDALMKANRIQIDNLCQFLPQDKVSSFSQMNPQQLLRATESAVLDTSLADAHDQIIELQKKRIESARDFDSLRANLDQKIQANEHRSRDVERLEEHKRRLEESKVMEKKLYWIRYWDQVKEIDTLKEEKTRLKAEHDMVKRNALIPLQLRCEEVADAALAAQKQLKVAKKKKESVVEEIDQLKKQVTAHENKQDQVRQELDQLRQNRVTKERRLGREQGKLKRVRKSVVVGGFRQEMEIEEEVYIIHEGFLRFYPLGDPTR